MRALVILLGVLSSALSAFGQLEDIPTFNVTTNDIVQSSIKTFFHASGTNKPLVTVKFDFTESGAKRLEEFYHSFAVGEQVRWRIGKFERACKIDERKTFARDSFYELPESESKTLVGGLRGKK